MICLKSLTFVVSITTTTLCQIGTSSCDLLEKSYLCGINNNNYGAKINTILVVICLKSLTFVVSITTRFSKRFQSVRCDLLEKSYLCGINNNSASWNALSSSVVICLKSLTFVVSITTRQHLYFHQEQLWFAWKVLPLWYQ